MAGAHRRSPPDLNPADSGDMPSRLLADGKGCSFFQAVRLLRHLVKTGAPAAQAVNGGRIRVRPNLSLAFPQADIDRIETLQAAGRETYRITANFLGLYGTSSPLPTFYTEDLLNEDSQDESVSREFIDIFNQRIYELLFEGWMKYRLFFQIREEQSPMHIQRLFCLLGLGSQAAGRRPDENQSDMRLLRYIGLFTQRPHSAAGLGALLKDALDDIPLCIVPCIPRRARIPEFQRLKTGLSGNRLGSDAYLGREIEDRAGKFRIRIGPLEQAAFLSFVPGRAGYETVTLLTALYMTEPLTCEVELILSAGQAQTTCLGDPMRAFLGVTTWVFSGTHLGEVTTRFEIQRL